MKLQYVAITGADDGVSIDDLNRIADRYPFVEWALLYMPERAGHSRFPSGEFIRNFRDRYDGAHTAMHLCGAALLGFIDDDPEIFGMMDGFDRIQLNLEFGDVGGQYDTDTLLRQIKRHPEFEFVIQYTPKSKVLLSALKETPNHAVLFDQSAGRGLLPDVWPAPLPGHFCGYAGGINPANIKETLEDIDTVAGDYKTWIDMESGVRTDDRFDLSKVEDVLSVAETWTV